MRINDTRRRLQYRGLDRFDARKQIVADLEAAGLLEADKPHKLMVPRGDRTNVIIEPMLTDQWFVAMSKPGTDGKSIAGKALEAVSSGEIKFVPENWVNTYNQWLNNIQDWCISRQLWWGHQIPAWYSDDGRCYVAHDESEAKSLARKDGYTANSSATTTCSIPGIPPHCGPSPRWTGRLNGRRSRTPRWISTCPRLCWSPASTSSSSGWRAW
jgi:valyl-tRNA synthetase